MCRKNGSLLFASLLFFSAFFPSILSAQEAQTEIAPYLPRLYVIALRYETQTENLKKELSASQINLTELGEKLRIYEKNATEYENRIISLSQESETLKKAQTDLTESIKISEDSWTKYAEKTEKEIQRLEKKVRFWSFVGKLFFFASIGEAAYITATTIF